MVLTLFMFAATMQVPQCKTDKDCAVVEATCGGWELVQKSKAAKREKEIKELRANAMCPANAAVLPKPVPMCVLSRCLEQPSRAVVDVQSRCASAEQTLRGVLDLQRTCKVDADCKLYELEGKCPFGCAESLRKDADVKSLIRYMDAYGPVCGACKNKCTLVNQAFCDVGTCAARFKAGAR